MLRTRLAPAPPPWSVLGPQVVLVEPDGVDRGWQRWLPLEIIGASTRVRVAPLAVPSPADTPNPWAFRLRSPTWAFPGREGPPSMPAAAVGDVWGAVDAVHRRGLVDALAEALPPGAPLAWVEPNGARVAGWGGGAPTAAECRRVLEVAGFGLLGAWALPGGPGVVARWRPGSLDRVSPWFAVIARRMGTLPP